MMKYHVQLLPKMNVLKQKFVSKIIQVKPVMLIFVQLFVKEMNLFVVTGQVFTLDHAQDFLNIVYHLYMMVNAQVNVQLNVPVIG